MCEVAQRNTRRIAGSVATVAPPTERSVPIHSLRQPLLPAEGPQAHEIVAPILPARPALTSVDRAKDDTAAQGPRAPQPASPLGPLSTPARVGASARPDAPSPHTPKSSPNGRTSQDERATSAGKAQSPEAREREIVAILAEAIRVQGNYGGTHQNQQRSLRQWQNQVLNDLHRKVFGSPLSWSAINADRPGVQSKVQAELKRVFGSRYEELKWPKFLAS